MGSVLSLGFSMRESINHSIAIFLTILFLGFITAPTIIMSVDNSIDISSFYGVNEEEESAKFKLALTFEDFGQDELDGTKSLDYIFYAYRVYPKPHLNLISPPPELI